MVIAKKKKKTQKILYLVGFDIGSLGFKDVQYDHKTTKIARSEV